jgi:hypothetical protein
MTIDEAIKGIDTLKPNNYTDEEKIKWLDTLDRMIKTEIIDKHEGYEEIVFEGYTTETPADTELLAPQPYDDMYLHWLESRIDYYNNEYAKYNNSVTSFNTMYSAFNAFYNRQHMPLGTKMKFF